MQEKVIKSKGDIFKIFISMYDCVDNNLIKNEDMEFYRKIFGNLKTSDDGKIFKKFVEERPKKIKDFYEYIDTSNLRVNSKEEFEIVEKILFTVTTKAIVMRFKYDSKEEARENFLKFEIWNVPNWALDLEDKILNDEERSDSRFGRQNF